MPDSEMSRITIIIMIVKKVKTTVTTIKMTMTAAQDNRTATNAVGSRNNANKVLLTLISRHRPLSRTRTAKTAFSISNHHLPSVVAMQMAKLQLAVQRAPVTILVSRNPPLLSSTLPLAVTIKSAAPMGSRKVRSRRRIRSARSPIRPEALLLMVKLVGAAK